MVKFNFNIDNEYFSKYWPTKRGYFITSIAIIFLILSFEKLLMQVCIWTIPFHITLLLILLALLIHDILWRYFTGRVILFVFNKILIAIHPNVLKEYKDLKTILMTIIKDRHVGNWFKIMILPEDFNLDNNTKAEYFLKNKRLNLLIWGESISGQEQGKEVTQYRLKFSYEFDYPLNNPAVKYLLIRDFAELVKERYWKVNKENSLKDISSLGESISDVSLYIIAICLLSRGNIGKGLNILEDSYFRINSDPAKKKLLICAKIKNYLISLYNLLSIIAWKEQNNRKKSVELTGKMLVLDDNNYDAHARMALYEYLEGRLPESRRHVKRCRNIDARHPCTIFDQAFYYILDRKYDKAAGRYKKLNQSEVDGLLAFEVSNFLLEEYLRKKEEIGFLFAAGYVNVKFVGHTELGLVQLKRFCKMAEGRSEYTEFYNIAKGALGNYASKVQ